MRRLVVKCCLAWMLIAPAASAQHGREAAAEELVAAVADHRLVLLGEMHGTREIPMLVGDVVERMSRSEPVLLALEIHSGEHARLAAYMDGDGSAAQRESLRKSPFWSVAPERNDGRRSEDMLDLVERVRGLRESGRDVAILPFDVSGGVSRGSQWRDQAMAAHLRSAYGALPRGRLLALTGNVHAMRERPGYAPPQLQEPRGAYLQDLAPLSVEISAREGAFHACTVDGCGPVPVGHAGTAGAQRDGSPFHHRIVLLRFTPARQVGQATD